MINFPYKIVKNKKEAKCLYLLNEDESDYKYIPKEEDNIKYILFNKDVSKDLLYSKHFIYNNDNKDFIYKLSNEIEKCYKNMK